MATLQLTPATVTVRFRRLEKIAGLVRDLDVPLSAVRVRLTGQRYETLLLGADDAPAVAAALTAAR